jgi:IS30 family transposase
VGHWEIDTVMGTGNDHCVVTLVGRATGYTLIGKLAARTMEEAAHNTIRLVRRYPEEFRTTTAHNGTEFQSYEDTNGLVRQYLPKRTSMAHVSQRRCEAIARKLNTRPRKRYD